MKNLSILRHNRLNVVMGASHSGKTTHLYNKAIEDARDGKKILFITLEESSDILINRFGKHKNICVFESNPDIITMEHIERMSDIIDFDTLVIDNVWFLANGSESRCMEIKRLLFCLDDIASKTNKNIRCSLNTIKPSYYESWFRRK